ncbi:chromatin assembly factor 1 subunit FAS1-like [Gastrolobium bilobum]|uniref:chromatin assembly factor 1 subunit FAS1-like n=1 Tax=Gastrolobium bilobum TaxID=150636 RepID=UPI002AB00E9B|nr:chromatin assembly factor 1 subunit FAS1-like [Gastrolobium bilobum]
MADAGEGDARKTKCQGGSTGKRKRKLEHLFAGDKETRIEAFEKELEALFGYYKEVKNQKVGVDVRYYGSRNATVGVLLEESEFPLARLVDEIHDTLKKVDPDPVTVTHATVKSCVISVGQRLMYGVTNDDADILEDHSESCLWCWETRDVKLIPASARGLFIFRRTCRSMIHERITAVSEMISSLKKPESEQNYCDGLIEASAELDKAYSEEDIRFLMDSLMQKNSVDMTQAKAKQEVKSILQQLDRHKREVKKGNKSMDNELQGKTLLVGVYLAQQQIWDTIR